MKFEVNSRFTPWPVIGLSGGIACGKTLASDFYFKKGAKIIDADLISRKVVSPGAPVLNEISSVFGQEILESNGTLNRKALNSKIFANNKNRLQLEKILHPLIFSEIQSQLNRLWERNAKKPILLVAPLLCETDLHKVCAKVLIITSSEENQVKRLRARDHFSEKEAKDRIQSQMQLTEKEKVADWVLENNDSKEAFLKKLNEFWPTLQNEWKIIQSSFS